MINNETNIRLSLSIPRNLNKWIDDFSKEIKKQGGFKLPKSVIIRAFIRAVKDSNLDIDLSNIRINDNVSISEKVTSLKIENILLNRIKDAIKN